MLALLAALPVALLPATSRDVPRDAVAQAEAALRKALPPPWQPAQLDLATIAEHLAAAGPACAAELRCLCSAAPFAAGDRVLLLDVERLGARAWAADLRFVRPCEDDVIDRRAAVIDATPAALQRFVSDAAVAVLRGRDLAVLRYGEEGSGRDSSGRGAVTNGSGGVPSRMESVSSRSGSVSSRSGSVSSRSGSVSSRSESVSSGSESVSSRMESVSSRSGSVSSRSGSVYSRSGNVSDEPARPPGAEALAAFERGRAFLEQSAYVPADQELTRALQLAPGHVPSLAARGRARLGLGQPVNALADFAAAHESAPQLALPVYGIAEAHRKLGHRDEALRFYKLYGEMGTAPDASLSLRHEAELWVKALERPE